MTTTENVATRSLDVYLASLNDDQPLHLREHGAYGWFTAEQLMTLEWADADIPIVPKVCEVLSAAREGGKRPQVQLDDAPAGIDTASPGSEPL